MNIILYLTDKSNDDFRRRILVKKTLFYLLFFLSSLLIITTPTQAKTFDSAITNDPEKPWTITFNSGITFNTVTKNSIYIQTASGERHPTILTISDDFKKVTITPQTPYSIGTDYSLIITKDVQSVTKKALSEETKMSFTLQGKYILSVQTTLNSLVSNIVVQSGKDVASIKISINGSPEIQLLNKGSFQFKKGILGLTAGDQLDIHAYTAQGTLLEKQTYHITQ